MLTMTFGSAYNMICSVHGGIPKLVEGTGLENREVVRAARGFESYFLRHFYVTHRGMEQLVARRAHNPKVVGSSPSSATMVS